MARRCSFKLGIWSVGTFLTILLVNPYANLLSKNSRFTETASCGLVSEIYLFWGWTPWTLNTPTNSIHFLNLIAMRQSKLQVSMRGAEKAVRPAREVGQTEQTEAIGKHWKTLDWWWLVWGIGKNIFPETWVISSQILRRAQSRAYGACCEIRWD